MDDFKKSITLEHLLMMASGLDCKDSYLYDWRGLIEMKNNGDWAQHVLDLPMAGPPGTSFEQCNGVSYLLSVIIHNTTKMKTLDEVHFAASVIDVPPKLELKEFGSKIVAGFLREIGSDIQVIANNKITLKCGTSSYRTDIKWIWNHNFPITSLVVSTYKNNKCIYLAVNPTGNPDQFAPIVESLRFE